MNARASTDRRGKLGGRRDSFSRVVEACGFNSLLRKLPERDALLVLAYHRIGDPRTAQGDPAVFSATAEAFEQQMAFIRNRMTPVSLDDFLQLLDADGGEWQGCRVLVTFDDGYRDNYEEAFPILQRHGVPAVFFLSTAFVGAHQMAWWDEIACIVRHAAVDAFTLRYPIEAHFDLRKSGVSDVLRRVLQLYKRPAAPDGARFIADLRAACRTTTDFSCPARPFLDWDEARHMAAAGMSIQSHAHTHRLLGGLAPEDQLSEMRTSYRILTEQLGKPPVAIAYPVGERAAFSDDTERLAKRAGYRVGFSLEDGVNRVHETNLWNVRRIAVDTLTMPRFRTQMAFASTTGHWWP